VFKENGNLPQHNQKLLLKQIPANVLMQTINLLGLPLAELETFIKNEVEENPFLEIEEGRDNYIKIEPESEETEEKSDDYTIGEITDTYEISKVTEQEYKRKKFVPEGDSEPESQFYKEEGLKEHLLFQAKLDIDDERIFTLASYIISELNEDGYLEGDISKFKNIDKYEFTEEEIEEVIKRIQKYDPIGCASRSIEECLVTQMEIIYPELHEIQTFKKIILDDFQALANKDYKHLSKKYKISESEIEKLLEIIKTLDPKPGRNFSENISFIMPEAIIEKNEDGKLEIEYNDSFIPKLRLKYIDLVKTKELSNEIKDKINKAKITITVIEYRKELLRKIISKIVEIQKDFLLNKTNYLKPLTIKDLADEMSVSISTISRAIKDKYILTPRGIFPLKHFLTRSAYDLADTKVSVDRIKELIKETIKNEKTPLPDQSIAKILFNKGIKISRRTVTKYREEMGIPPAFQRKNNPHKLYS
jgi:RNA polymerase sigma-54 factor